ncbi:hypothetical protein [Streptomyces fungicidicus]
MPTELEEITQGTNPQQSANAVNTALRQTGFVHENGQQMFTTSGGI